MVADLLARGSLSPATFPGMRVSQWQIGRRLTAHSCGGSRGIGRLVAHAPRSLLIPAGTTVAILSRYGRRGQVNAMAQHKMSASLIGRLGSSAFRLSNVAVSMSLAGSRFSLDSALRPFQHRVL